MIDLVCSVCGSTDWKDVQHSIDKRWPVARCHGEHRDRGQLWFPLISSKAFLARKKLRHEEKPIDLFGGLSIAERNGMTAPLRNRSIVTVREK